MNQWLTYLAPPTLGALIGYVTNYVAIRMLFKPLHPWYILGLRLPMTPGVIPAKRHELAENIGRMVGEHLLTPDDIRAGLARQGFQAQLQELINDKLEGLLNKDLGPAASLVPERFRYQFTAGVKILRWRGLKHLHAYIAGDAFAKAVLANLEERRHDLLARPLGECLSPEMSANLQKGLEKGIAAFLAGPGVEKWLTDYLNSKIDGFLVKGGSINDLLPERLRDSLLELLEGQTPRLLQQLAGLLEEPATREKLVTAIVGLVNSFIGSLGPMAALLGGFISGDTIARKIREFLDTNGSELAAQLLDESVRVKVAGIIRARADEFMARPLAAHLADIAPEQVAQAREWVAGRLTGLLTDPATVKSITSMLGDALLDQKQRPLGDVLADLIGPEGIDRAADWLGNELITLLRSPRVKRLIDRLITDLIEERLLRQPIGRLKAFLPHQVQDGLRAYLFEQVGELLAREVPPLVDTINIRQIVTRKVDSLDLLKLEDLLLSIMSEQFKYINLFGGLLGFMIGLLNLLVLTL